MKLSEEILLSIIHKSYRDSKGANVVGTCPYCEKEDHFGISIHKDGNPWRCLKCGRSGKKIYGLLKHIGKSDLIHGKRDVVHSKPIKININIPKSEKLNVYLPKKSLPLGWKRIFSDSYLDSRGFLKEDYNFYKVGRTSIFKQLKDYIIILVEENVECKGYVARCDWDKEKFKEYNDRAKAEGTLQKLRYQNSANTDFGKLLFGFDEIISGITKTVILVEGIFGKVNVTRTLSLYDNEETKCCATFGKKVSVEQLHKLKDAGIENIILIFDNDAINDSKRYGADLEYNFSTLIGFLKDERDPGDLSEEEIWDVMSNLMSPVEFSNSKIKKIKLI